MLIEEQQLWLSSILEEYKYLRTESLAAMTKQHSALQYGVTAIGVSLGLAFNASDVIAKFLAFAVLIPFLSLLFYIIYANEFARMVRAGRYIDNIETKINDEIPGKKQALGWEQWLEKEIDGKTPRLPFYYAVPLVFLASCIFSSIMAYIYHGGGPFCDQWNIGLLIIVVFVVVVFIMAVSFRLMNLREGYNKYFD